MIHVLRLLPHREAMRTPATALVLILALAGNLAGQSCP